MSEKPKKKKKAKKDSISRGNASQFFILGELCRRGYSAVVSLGNTPNVDILCSNKEGTRFAHTHLVDSRCSSFQDNGLILDDS